MASGEGDVLPSKATSTVRQEGADDAITRPLTTRLTTTVFRKANDGGEVGIGGLIGIRTATTVATEMVKGLGLGIGVGDGDVSETAVVAVHGGVITASFGRSTRRVATVITTNGAGVRVHSSGGRIFDKVTRRRGEAIGEVGGTVEAIATFFKELSSVGKEGVAVGVRLT